jgi:hypothetical protein
MAPSRTSFVCRERRPLYQSVLREPCRSLQCDHGAATSQNATFYWRLQRRCRIRIGTCRRCTLNRSCRRKAARFSLVRRYAGLGGCKCGGASAWKVICMEETHSTASSTIPTRRQPSDTQETLQDFGVRIAQHRAISRGASTTSRYVREQAESDRAASARAARHAIQRLLLERHRRLAHQQRRARQCSSPSELFVARSGSR